MLGLLLAIVVVGIAFIWTGHARKVLQEKAKQAKAESTARPCCGCAPCYRACQRHP